jgi:hypothetical protein
MPTVRLSYHECLNGLLPPVCAVCGTPADGGVRFVVPTRTILYAVSALCTICPPLFVLSVALLNRWRRMQVPMCEPHRAAWLRWERSVGRSYLVVIGGAFTAAVLLFVFLPSERVDELLGLPAGGGWKWVAIPLGYYAVAIAWFVPVSLRQTRHVRTTQATGHGIRLSGVHAEFARAVREERARDPDPARLARFGDPRDDYDDEP